MRKSKHIQPIHLEIHEKYPRMDFKIRRDGSIYIYNDPDLADEMKNWKSPYNECWNYSNQLQKREKTLNKRINSLNK